MELLRKILSYWRIRNYVLELAYSKKGIVGKYASRLFRWIDRVGE